MNFTVLYVLWGEGQENVFRTHPHSERRFVSFCALKMMIIIKWWYGVTQSRLQPTELSGGFPPSGNVYSVNNLA